MKTAPYTFTELILSPGCQNYESSFGWLTDLYSIPLTLMENYDLEPTFLVGKS
jgi:hypothetical protein